SAESVIARLVGDVHASEPHESVREAIRLLPGMLTGPVRLAEVARVVHLSADRLGRMFARDTGMSFPAYVRWARLIRTIEVARTGGTLTDAAHAA
ncbi:AraC family transcriptional regulator, partial [Mycobacteroides abscessus subsp. massiliense]